MKRSMITFKQLFEKHHEHLADQDRQIKSKTLTSYLSLKESSCLSTNCSAFNTSKFKKITSNVRPKTAKNYSESKKSFEASNAKISHICEKVDPRKTEIYKQNSEFLAIMKKQITSCLQSRTPQELIEIRKQIGNIHSLCFEMEEITYQRQAYSIFAAYQQEITKNVKNRIPRILFYLIYIKYLELINNEQSLHLQLAKLQFCQYYCREFSFNLLTLSICFRIKDVYIRMKNYDEARKYARKCMKIAVYTKNKGAQFKVIESFKIISYYTGVLNQYNDISVSSQERELILKTYSILDDLPDIIGKKASNESKELDFAYDSEDIGNAKVLEQITENVATFIRNLAHMNKQFTEHSRNISKTIKKVGKVGQVKKYMKDGNFITLQPRSRNLLNKNQSQVLMTNLGRNIDKQNKSNRFFQQYLPKYKAIIKQFINYCQRIISYNQRADLQNYQPDKKNIKHRSKRKKNNYYTNQIVNSHSIIFKKQSK